LEVRNATTQELVDIHAIPLPLKSDGERWAGGLPDGTADALSIDSAGKWEWECPTDESDMSSNMTWNYGSNRMKSSTLASIVRAASNYNQAPLLLAESRRAIAWSSGLSNNHDGIAQDPGSKQIIVYANDATDYPTGMLLYPLATPTTESGYIDLPSVPAGATVDIPELSEVGVRFFVEGAKEVVENAEAWGRRALAAEARIEALEAAVAALATQ
jgi:hypothetical protein